MFIASEESNCINLNWAIVEFAGRKIPPLGELQGAGCVAVVCYRTASGICDKRPATQQIR